MPPPGPRRGSAVATPAHGREALRGLGVAHRRQHLVAHLVDGELGVGRRGHDVGVPGERLGRHVEVEHLLGAVRHHLADRLRTLDEEAAGPLTHGAPGQCPHRLDPVRPWVGQGGRRRGHVPALRGVVRGFRWVSAQAVASAVAGTLARAISTRALKAASSLTASSASMRRSTSISAALRPWMKRL